MIRFQTFMFSTSGVTSYFIVFMACVTVSQAQWTESKNLGPVYDLEKAPKGELFAATTRGAYRTSDGINWEPADSGLHYPEGAVYTLMLIDNELYLGTELGLYRLNDDSVWEKTSDDLDNLIVRDIVSLIVKDSVLFAGTLEKGVFRSYDNGETWLEANIGLPSTTVQGFTSYLPIQAFSVMGSVLFLGSFGGRVFRSDDNGDNWREIDFIPEKSLYTMEAVGSLLFVGVSSYEGSGLYRSADTGNTWEPVYDVQINSLMIYEQNIFAGGWETLALSSDGGDSWQKFDEGLSADQNDRKYLLSLIIYENNLLIGTGITPGCGKGCSVTGGVMQRPLNDFLPSTGILHFPKNNFTIKSNEDGIRMGFSMEKSGVVEINLYSMQGKRVTTLAGGNYMAGFHNIIISPLYLSNKMYFAKLKVQGMSYTKKISIVK